MEETLEGHITISRALNGPPKGHWRIQLICESSGVHFAEAILTDEQMAQALASSFTACKFTLRGAHRVGSKSENKTEWVQKTGDYYNDPVQAAKDCARFTVDGWAPRLDDLWNRHRLDRETGKYEVSFFRYVDADGNPVD